MPEARFQLTAHAAIVIAEREIGGAWIERVLSSPEKIEADRRDRSLAHALGRIAERDNRAYFDRRLRGKP